MTTSSFDLAPLLDAAGREHPDIAVDDAELAAHFAHHAREARDASALRGGDLLLAFGCARGSEVAVATFQSRYGADIARALAKIRVGTMPSEDIAQELARTMFLPPEPKILEYSGRGDLRSWVRVVATRFALDRARVKKNAGERLPEEGWLDAQADAADGPETTFLRKKYGAEITRAIEEAARAIDVEDRNALREHYARGLTIDQIAAIHGIHRATAARRVQRAREALMSATMRALDRDHGLAGRELESVLALVRSQFHLTLERVLA